MANLSNKVVEKINKLLALGNNSAAAENERETALRQAYSLLAKHNLQMEDLVGQDDRGRTQVLAKKHEWAKRLAHSIAKLFFCEYLFADANANYCFHIFVGKEVNRQIASDLFLYLHKSLMKESRAHVRKNNIVHSPYKAEMDFLVGASISIYHKANQLRAEKEAELATETPSAGGTSLVLASYYEQEQEANRDWMKNNMVTVAAKKTSRQLQMTPSLIKGMEHGKNVHLGGSIGK